ncbi:MAG: hypothetical protein ACYCYE_12710 [Clostridia bacterium]
MGLEDIFVIAYREGMENGTDKEVLKGLKSMYKSQCEPAIKVRNLPPTLIEYITLLVNEDT